MFLDMKELKTARFFLPFIKTVATLQSTHVVLFPKEWQSHISSPKPQCSLRMTWSACSVVPLEPNPHQDPPLDFPILGTKTLHTKHKHLRARRDFVCSKPGLKAWSFSMECRVWRLLRWALTASSFSTSTSLLTSTAHLQFVKSMLTSLST